MKVKRCTILLTQLVKPFRFVCCATTLIASLRYSSSSEPTLSLHRTWSWWWNPEQRGIHICSAFWHLWQSMLMLQATSLLDIDLQLWFPVFSRNGRPVVTMPQLRYFNWFQYTPIIWLIWNFWVRSKSAILSVGAAAAKKMAWRSALPPFNTILQWLP